MDIGVKRFLAENTAIMLIVALSMIFALMMNSEETTVIAAIVIIGTIMTRLPSWPMLAGSVLIAGIMFFIIPGISLIIVMALVASCVLDFPLSWARRKITVKLLELA
jgi:hypothetical protein